MTVPVARTFRARCARALLAVLVSAFTVTSALAQGEDTRPLDLWLARWWNISNGLPQSTINDLLQTQDGELWIATFGGLLRFDGVSFRSFDLTTLPDLDSIRVTALTADPRGGVWFATQSGFAARLEHDRIVESTRLDHRREVVALVRHADGAVWVQTSMGSVHRFANEAWTELLAPGRGGEYEGIETGADGTVAVANGRQLVLFRADGSERERVEAPARILSVAPRSDGGFWIGLEDGPARLREGVIERFSSVPPITLKVSALREDGRGNVWLGTPRGAACIAIDASRGPRIVVGSAEQLPPGFEVRALLFDREGNLWTGSTNAGLMRLRPNRIDTPGLEKGQLPVSALCDDGTGGAWVALGNRGLAHIDAGERRMRFEALGIPPGSNSSVHSLLFDARGRVWAGVNQHWYRKNPGETESFALVLDGRVFKSRTGPAVARPDGEVWLSSNTGALVRVATDDRVVEEDALHVTPNVIVNGASDSLWIGADGVLIHRAADGAAKRYARAEGLPGGSVRDLLVDQDGSVWIATYGGGLARLAHGRIERLSRLEGLQDNSLTRILDDGDGRFWILSNLGLMVAERDDLLDALSGRRSRVSPVVIGPEGGMNEANYGLPAGFRSSSGELWFGTIQSTVRVDAKRFPCNRVPPVASIEHVRADELELPTGGTPEVSDGTRRVEFEYTAFALSAPERVRFRYQLAGYDEDWVDGGEQRRAAYTGLWPGRYTFRVLARNEEGVWGDRPAELAVVVLPSWWQTGWFGAAAVACLAALLFGAHRMRVSVLDRRARVELELARARADAEQRESRLREELAHVARVATAGELATSLAHEVNQPLAAIATNAQAGRRFLARDAYAREDLDEILRDISQEAQRASEVIRRLREFLRKHASERKRLDLAQVVSDTLPLVRRELADGRIEVVRDLDADLPAVDADPVQLQQVLVNLIKNACEAMAGQEGARRITLATQRVEGRVELAVRDTGPGLALDVSRRLFEPFVTTKPTGMGLGLAICRSIVEAHGGRLSAEGAPGGGTTFRVELPACPNESANP
ncbi:MAG: GHKL domain-containing protein [Planctomycetes bacterium]|nr:GHKL domain-containing protein [Planctomycetota bacterium]